MTNTYVFDPEDRTEMARLIHLDRATTKGMGGLLTGLPDLPETAQVLDICCGPGGWVLDLAYDHPGMKVTGVDVSAAMIDYARARAQSREICNTFFKVMSILEPFKFNDNSFDLVNARLLSMVVHSEKWPAVVQECYRITKPGGVIRLTEADVTGVTTSPAFSKLSQGAYQVGKAIGYGFSPDGQSFVITPMLGKFLRDSGCENIQNKMHAVDFSADSEAWADLFHNYEIAFKAMIPLIIKAGLGTQEELDHLYQQFLIEVHLEEFRGMWPYMSVWGTKPL